MKLRILIIIVVALAIAGMIIVRGFDDNPHNVSADSSTIASTTNSTRDDLTDDSFGEPDAPEFALGRKFHCTPESVDPARLYVDENLTMEERAVLEEQRFREFSERLMLSGDLNHQLAVGLMQAGKASPEAIDTLAPLLISMPENEILHWRLLEACNAKPSHPACSDDSGESRAIAVLGSNSAIWAKVSYFRSERNDEEGALAAMRNAANANETQDFWGDEVALLFDSLAIESDYSTTERLVLANGIAAGYSSPEFMLVKHCQKFGGDSSTWRDVCTTYGQRKEIHSTTFMGRMIGNGLQASMHRLNGNDAGVAAAEQRESALLHELRSPSAQDGNILLMVDETVAIAWLQHLHIYGEISAQKFLNSEVERVSRIPGYDPCPPR